MHFLVAVLYGLVIWMCPFGSLLSMELPDTIDKVRLSVVAIGTVMPARPNGAKFTGTGFVVGSGRLVITNHHVLPEIMNQAKKEALVVFAGRGKAAEVRHARILRADPTHDLALLEVSGAPLTPMRLKVTAVREGQDVAFTGFPLGMVLGLYPVTHKGIISSITPIVIPANTSRNLTAQQIQRLRKPFDVYQLDGTAYPGNSGSPVYDINSGEVLGVVNSVFVKGTKEAMIEKPSGISYAIPVQYVNDLMKRPKK